MAPWMTQNSNELEVIPQNITRDFVKLQLKNLSNDPHNQGCLMSNKEILVPSKIVQKTNLQWEQLSYCNEFCLKLARS